MTTWSWESWSTKQGALISGEQGGVRGGEWGLDRFDRRWVAL